MPKSRPVAEFWNPHRVAEGLSALGGGGRGCIRVGQVRSGCCTLMLHKMINL
jgi:hypothetical protein